MHNPASIGNASCAYLSAVADEVWPLTSPDPGTKDSAGAGRADAFPVASGAGRELAIAGSITGR